MPAIVRATEALLAFMTEGCEREFSEKIRNQGWPETEIPEIVAKWGVPRILSGHTGGNQKVMRALTSIEQTFRATFLQLQRMTWKVNRMEGVHTLALQRESELKETIQAMEQEMVQERTTRRETERKLAASKKDRMDALRLLKATREKQLLAERDLEILRERTTTGTGTSSCPSK